jgi:putative spermidine/putrescine transport system ATP-binding protein
MNVNTNQGVNIRLQSCAKTFKQQRVLNPIDLDIRAGETLVLLGPSGCGKTTTLRLIAGLEHPDAGGKVFFENDEVTALPIEERKVGMVFQSYALFPNMNVRENIEYGLRIAKMPPHERAQRVNEMLAMMQIDALAERLITQLSGGQKQRVALARAIAIRPRVLLLDEPLTALDARLRETLRSDIDALLRQLGITTVYVTHDQAEAMVLGDRIAVMDHGHIAQIGTPQDIYFRPQSAVVADFIGTVNTIDGKRFRPEDASLSSANDAAQSWRGIVKSSFFLGDHRRVTVELEGGNTVILKLPPREAIEKGEYVSVQVHAWQEAAC